MDAPFHFTPCCICGKDFIKRPGHIYKVQFAGRVEYCCSYTCHNKAMKAKENSNSSMYTRIRKELNSSYEEGSKSKHGE